MNWFSSLYGATLAKFRPTFGKSVSVWVSRFESDTWQAVDWGVAIKRQFKGKFIGATTSFCE